MISPTLLSGGVKENYTSVSFLGSILERISAVPEKPFTLDRVFLIQKIKRLREVPSRELNLTPPQGLLRVQNPQPEKEKFLFYENKLNAMVLKTDYKRKRRPRIRFEHAVLTGEAKNRILLYKPRLYMMSIFPFYFSSDYNATVRFRISKHGFVERPECMVSSGSSSIDRLAVKYVRSWQFVPSGEEVEREQEGVVRVDFDAE